MTTAAVPRVSVIIPAYRAAATIGRAVNSLLAQTVPAAEIVIVDDGSPEPLAPALARYGDRVQLLRKDNGGAASARNLGIDHAGGELLAFLDADDYWEPGKLERQLALMGKYPEVGLCASTYYHETPGSGKRTLSAHVPPRFQERSAAACRGGGVSDGDPGLDLHRAGPPGGAGTPSVRHPAADGRRHRSVGKNCGVGAGVFPGGAISDAVADGWLAVTIGCGRRLSQHAAGDRALWRSARAEGSTVRAGAGLPQLGRRPSE